MSSSFAPETRRDRSSPRRSPTARPFPRGDSARSPPAVADGQGPGHRQGAAVSLARRLAAEAVGTALLLAIIIGSGIMGDDLARGNTAIALLANALATGAGLAVLILVFGPVSGAHLNPLVSIAE